jgi:hypothetical protein
VDIILGKAIFKILNRLWATILKKNIVATVVRLDILARVERKTKLIKGTIMYRYSPFQFINALNYLNQPYKTQNVAQALVECDMALSNFPDDLHSGQSREYMAKLEQFTNIDGIEDPDREGIYLVKARSLSRRDIEELKHIIGVLSTYRR